MPNIRLLEADGANIRLRPLFVIRNRNIRCFPVPTVLSGDITLASIYPFRDFGGEGAAEVFEWDGAAWARCPGYIWDGADWIRARAYLRFVGRWGQINTTGLEM
jgi:hypothetical protein